MILLEIASSLRYIVKPEEILVVEADPLTQERLRSLDDRSSHMPDFRGGFGYHSYVDVYEFDHGRGLLAMPHEVMRPAWSVYTAVTDRSTAKLLGIEAHDLHANGDLMLLKALFSGRITRGWEIRHGWVGMYTFKDDEGIMIDIRTHKNKPVGTLLNNFARELLATVQPLSFS